MKLTSQFAVPSPPERVFPLFLDADVMRECLPGCEELVRVDDATFRGRLVSSVAHVRFNAAFSAALQSVEEPHTIKALLKGEDNRLGSSINVDAVLDVQPDAGGSLVEYRMDLAIWGKIGRLGESIVRRRTAEVEAQFVERFTAAASATSDPVAAAVAAARGGAPAGAPVEAAVPAAGEVVEAPAEAPAGAATEIRLALVHLLRALRAVAGSARILLRRVSSHRRDRRN
jgi:carbon monoxide dehydrogenase subunit G